MANDILVTTGGSTWILHSCIKKWLIALAGNRTRVNCLEGSYANHYTTNALNGDHRRTLILLIPDQSYWYCSVGVLQFLHTQEQNEFLAPFNLRISWTLQQCRPTQKTVVQNKLWQPLSPTYSNRIWTQSIFSHFWNVLQGFQVCTLSQIPKKSTRWRCMTVIWQRLCITEFVADWKCVVRIQTNKYFVQWKRKLCN